MPITLDGTNGITTPSYGGADTSEYLVPVTAFKNRIINGAMVIDQRNAGASITPTDNQYSLDRWQCRLSQASKYSVQQTTTAPAGFLNSLRVTSLSAYTVGASEFFTVNQQIEGFNIADLNWGSANAKTVTLSAWVYSSLTGTFGGSLENAGTGRSYPFTYTISSANTWTQITVTVPGDTTGSWSTDNGTGIRVWFSLGAGSTYSGTAGSWASADYRSATGATSVVGTNGATWYITGVQLEVGSTATSFDYRPYGTELALCQRYYETPFQVAAAGGNHALNTYGSNALATLQFKVSKRAEPTISLFNTSSGSISAGGTSYAPYNYAYLYLAGSTTGYAGWAASAEL